MFEATPNLRLPYLYVGQAQKEIIHNEALAMLDAVMFASLESELTNPPSTLTDIDAGRRWLVGATPLGSWAGHAGEIAYWTGDGWRFVLVPDFCRVFRADLGHDMIRQAGSWITVPPVNTPTGGAVIDQEARSTLATILSILRTTGLIPTT